eukprot:scaffold435_cov342-Pavlova_lutheri.AAC.26
MFPLRWLPFRIVHGIRVPRCNRVRSPSVQCTVRELDPVLASLSLCPSLSVGGWVCVREGGGGGDPVPERGGFEWGVFRGGVAVLLDSSGGACFIFYVFGRNHGGFRARRTPHLRLGGARTHRPGGIHGLHGQLRRSGGPVLGEMSQSRRQAHLSMRWTHLQLPHRGRTQLSARRDRGRARTRRKAGKRGREVETQAEKGQR